MDDNFPYDINISEILDYVENHSNTGPVFHCFEEVRTQFDFEIWCCEQLTLMGHLAHLRPQGDLSAIDVLARVGNQKLGIRCDFTETDSDNNLTMILSALEQYDLDYAVMLLVTEVPTSMRQVAEELGVIIITKDELSHLDALTVAH